ncbi:MAG: hypothetical protein HYS86_00920 [Candidatus Chisholmbacteria bacterium]|nr:hypothetical protein [Candidatus Chisholmbacteria bacterium]
MSSPTAPPPQNPISRPQNLPPISPPPGQTTQPPLVKSMDLTKNKLSMKVVVIALGIVVAGIASGFGLNVATSGSLGIKSTTEAGETGVKAGDVVGVTESTFKDSATGVLVRGGVDGEGSHHLLREGGPDQTAYLTSSVVDLNLFEGHKVEVWGETFDAQKAGWLMDVGRVKVLQLNAPLPFEEVPAEDE